MKTHHNVPLKFITKPGEIKTEPEDFLRLFRAAQTAQTSTGEDRRVALATAAVFDGFIPTAAQVKTLDAPDVTIQSSGVPPNENKIANSFKGVDWDVDTTETSGLTENESVIVNNLIRKIIASESELNRGMNPLAVFISDRFGVFSSEMWPKSEAFGKLPPVKRRIAKVKVITMCGWVKLLPLSEHFV